MIRWPPDVSTLLLLPALFLAFTVHEVAHALVAFLLGDTSQVERKRLSFNPVRHVSWLGMVAFLLFGFGWAKPVWVDYTRLRVRNRALGVFLVSISGAAANLLLAAVAYAGLLLAVLVASEVGGQAFQELYQSLQAFEPGIDARSLALALTYNVALVNVILAGFNLIPLPPLDGFQALVSLAAVIRGGLKRGTARRSWMATSPGSLSPDPSERSPAQIHFDIALEYHRQGEWDEAIARYRQAIAHDSELGLAYYNLGLAYWAKGHWQLAASSFRAAAKSGRDPGLALQADLRLRQVKDAEDAGGTPLPEPPPPLEMGEQRSSASAPAPPLDPSVARGVWRQLAGGGVALLVLGLMSWAYLITVLL